MEVGHRAFPVASPSTVIISSVPVLGRGLGGCSDGDVSAGSVCVEPIAPPPSAPSLVLRRPSRGRGRGRGRGRRRGRRRSRCKSRTWGRSWSQGRSRGLGARSLGSRVYPGVLDQSRAGLDESDSIIGIAEFDLAAGQICLFPEVHKSTIVKPDGQLFEASASRVLEAKTAVSVVHMGHPFLADIGDEVDGVNSALEIGDALRVVGRLWDRIQACLGQGRNSRTQHHGLALSLVLSALAELDARVLGTRHQNL